MSHTLSVCLWFCCREVPSNILFGPLVIINTCNIACLLPFQLFGILYSSNQLYRFSYAHVSLFVVIIWGWSILKLKQLLSIALWIVNFFLFVEYPCLGCWHIPLYPPSLVARIAERRRGHRVLSAVILHSRPLVGTEVSI